MALDPFSPLPGEVRFSLGDQAGQPGAMVWHYREPRQVRRLRALPVPLSITSHEDPPMDLKVRKREKERERKSERERERERRQGE